MLALVPVEVEGLITHSAPMVRPLEVRKTLTVENDPSVWYRESEYLYRDVRMT